MKRIAVPGAFFVDVVPPREYDCMNPFVNTGTHSRCDATVRYLPSWFPGVQFHRFAEKIRENVHNAMYLPFEHVVDALEVRVVAIIVIDSSANFGAQLGGKIEPSIVSTCLENFEELSKSGANKEVISTTAGMVYIGKYPNRCPPEPFLPFSIGMSETVRVAAGSVAWSFSTCFSQTPY